MAYCGREEEEEMKRKKRKVCGELCKTFRISRNQQVETHNQLVVSYIFTSPAQPCRRNGRRGAGRREGEEMREE